MNVLSLFDGMSCGRIALDRAGIKVDNYFASEVDKYAMKVAKANYPDTHHIGDVTRVKACDLLKIDLLIGGSPCQGFSFAGKQLNFDDERSKLFFEFVRLLKECKPRYFMLENVKMKKEYQHVISEHLGVEPIEINSALVSAQNRKRLYWTNIPRINQPIDKGLLLADVLESEVEEKYKLSEKLINGLINGSPAFNGRFKPHKTDEKSYCLTARYHKMGKTDPYVYCVASRGRYDDLGGIFQNLEARGDDKTNSLTTVQKDNYIASDSFIRKLTPTECERLQTVPDNYTNHVSNTQRYRMLGNGWTIDVIAHIFNNIPVDVECEVIA